MKFNEIPQLIPSHYVCDVSLAYVPETLARYSESQAKFGYKFELCPDFQRGHVWTQEQKSKYIEWLLRGGESGRDIWFNQCRTSDFKADMVCLDGLQRLTAVCEFLSDKVQVFGLLHSQFEGRLNPAITLKFHILKLQSRKEILEFYLSFNAGGTPHKPSEIERVRGLLAKE